MDVSQILVALVAFAAVIGATAWVAAVPVGWADETTPAKGKHKHKHASTLRTFLLSPQLHIRRKLQHASSGIVILLLYRFLAPSLSSTFCVLCLAAACVGLFVAHQLRLRHAAMQRWIMENFGSLMREHEKRSLPGAFWMLAGCGACIAAWPARSIDGDLAAATAPSTSCPLLEPDIASLCILFISIGDPLAGTFGFLIGGRDAFRSWMRGKSVIASMLAGLVCTLIGWVWMEGVAMMHGTDKATCHGHALLDDRIKAMEPCDMQHVYLSLHRFLYAAIGSFASSFAELLPLPLDDNLRVPVLTGSVLALARWSGQPLYPLHMQPQCAG